MTTDQTPEPPEPGAYPSIDDAYLALPKETRVAILNHDPEALATWQRAAGYIPEEDTP